MHGKLRFCETKRALRDTHSREILIKHKQTPNNTQIKVNVCYNDTEVVRHGAYEKITKRLFFLPPVLTILISLPAYGFVIYTLTHRDVLPAFRQMMTASTGAGVSMIVVGVAAFMIVRSTRELKTMKPEKEM